VFKHSIARACLSASQAATIPRLNGGGVRAGLAAVPVRPRKQAYQNVTNKGPTITNYAALKLYAF